MFGASRADAASPDAAVEMVAMNLDDDASAASAISAVLQRAGRIDAIVNNAGYALTGPIEEAAIAEARAPMKRLLPYKWFEGIVGAAMGV